MSNLPLVSPLDRALFLKAQPYLDGLSSSVLAVLASYTTERFYSAGSSIRTASTPIERLIFLGSGVVDVGDPGANNDPSMRIAAPGAIGLAHYFSNSKATPSVRAVDDTICLEIATNDIEQIIEDHFSLLLQMARTSCEQAVLTTKQLGDSRLPEPGFESKDHADTPVHLDLVQRLARAKRAPFFRDTNLTLLGELFREDKARVIRAGEALWKSGDPTLEIAFVLDGEFRTMGDVGQSVAPAGAALGAWEILSETTRFEGWIAERPSRVLTIHKELFVDLLEDHLEFAQSYLRYVNERIVKAWSLLADTRPTDSTS